MEADVYVLDTGINLGHEEFRGRASWCYTAEHALWADMGFRDPNGDNNGHGTHVAGIAIGKVYGVAKHARVVSIKVLNHAGWGFLWDVISGMVAGVTRILEVGRRAVVNMSFGSSERIELLDWFVDYVVTECNIPIVTSAGNKDEEACHRSPAAAGGLAAAAITVAAADRDDYMAKFSNYGTCVDVLAPGKCIRSAFHKCTKTYRTLDGTSASAAFVSGIIARRLAVDPSANVTYLKQVVAETAAAGKIIIPPYKDSTPNLLVQADCQAVEHLNGIDG